MTDTTNATNLVPVTDQERIALLVQTAGSMEVFDTASNLAASEFLRDVKGLRERLASRVTDLRRPYLTAANAISETAKPYLDDLAAAEQHLKGVAGTWVKEQRDIARDEEQARMNTLERAVAEGRHVDADAALEALMEPVETPWRAPGTSLQTRWKAEVSDLMAYATWAVTRLHEDKWLLPNQALLDAEARAVKSESTIPGVRFNSETSLAASGR